MSNVHWLPLESNPEVINRYLNRLGVAKKWGVSDVLSLDEEYTAIIPTPCLAILLLFPVTDEYIKFVVKSAEYEDQTPELKNVYFMRQTVTDACGTIALIHAIANNKRRLHLRSNSVLKRFLDYTKHLSPKEKGEELGLDLDIADMHEETANETEAVSDSVCDSDDDSDSKNGSDSGRDSDSNSGSGSDKGDDGGSVSNDDGDRDDDDSVKLHFIALVKVDDKLVEFDGNKMGPVVHATTTDETFVRDAFRVCQSFIDREPASLKFNVMNFGPIKGI